MEEIIKRIIEIDKMEREMINSAQKAKEGTELNLNKLRSELRENYLARAKRRIEKVKDVEEEYTKKRLVEENKLIEEKIDEINQIYQDCEEAWVEQLVNRTLEG